MSTLTGFAQAEVVGLTSSHVRIATRGCGSAAARPQIHSLAYFLGPRPLPTSARWGGVFLIYLCPGLGHGPKDCPGVRKGWPSYLFLWCLVAAGLGWVKIVCGGKLKLILLHRWWRCPNPDLEVCTRPWLFKAHHDNTGEPSSESFMLWRRQR